MMIMNLRTFHSYFELQIIERWIVLSESLQSPPERNKKKVYKKRRNKF